jgi:hypothetical protein
VTRLSYKRAFVDEDQVKIALGHLLRRSALAFWPVSTDGLADRIFCLVRAKDEYGIPFEIGNCCQVYFTLCSNLFANALGQSGLPASRKHAKYEEENNAPAHLSPNV